MSLMVFAPIGAGLALIFAAFYTYKIFKVDEGTDKMKYIAESIRKGANAFLKRQYKGVAIFFVIMFIILFILAQFNFVSIFFFNWRNFFWFKWIFRNENCYKF